MAKTRGANTRKAAQKIRKRWKRQGYKGARIDKTPKSQVGKYNQKKYSVASGSKSKRS